MPAYDLAQRIGGWIADTISNDPVIGREIGYAVTCQTHPTSEGDAVTWTFLMTLRSPFLGASDFAATTTVQVNVPSEDGVRHFAASSLEKLRAQFDEQKRAGLAAGNGRRP